MLTKEINYNENMDIQVTIGICAKNASKVIDEALNSIITQDFSHTSMEIIRAITLTFHATKLKEVM